MTLALARKTLRDARLTLIGWSVGIGVWMAIYLPFYTQMSNQAVDLVQTLPPGLRNALGLEDLFSDAGYVEATVYNIYIPVMVIFCAALLADRAITGPEDSGALETLIALPLSRRQFVLGRFTALALGVVAVGLAQWVLAVGYTEALGMDVEVAGLAVASLGLTLLGVCFGTLGLAVGAATGRRAAVLGVTGGVAVAAYALNAFHALVETLEPLRWLSLFYYYLGGDPLRGGFPAGYFGVLAGITATLLVVALVTFDRRDVGT